MNYKRIAFFGRKSAVDFAVYKAMCQSINTSEINQVSVGNNQFVECIPSLLTYWSVPSIFALLEAGRYVRFTIFRTAFRIFRAVDTLANQFNNNHAHT